MQLIGAWHRQEITNSKAGHWLQAQQGQNAYIRPDLDDPSEFSISLEATFRYGSDDYRLVLYDIHWLRRAQLPGPKLAIPLEEYWDLPD